jgi:hypothetical protein
MNKIEAIRAYFHHVLEIKENSCPSKGPLVLSAVAEMLDPLHEL